MVAAHTSPLVFFTKLLVVFANSIDAIMVIWEIRPTLGRSNQRMLTAW